MRRHCKLVHCGLQWVQKLMMLGKDGQPPVIPTRKNSGAQCCDTPLCTSCQLGKRKIRPTGDKRSTERRPGVLKEGDLMPGERVSLDQYQSSVKGRLPSTKGKEKVSQMYTGGTNNVDHASCTHTQPKTYAINEKLRQNLSINFLGRRRGKGTLSPSWHSKTAF